MRGNQGVVVRAREREGMANRDDQLRRQGKPCFAGSHIRCSSWEPSWCTVPHGRQVTPRQVASERVCARMREGGGRADEWASGGPTHPLPLTW
jgi:hypothetical protein